jgi:hypothetical protein
VKNGSRPIRSFYKETYIRDIDPVDSRQDLKQNIASGLRIKDASEVEVKSLRAAAWGTQTTIAVVPAS